MSKPRCNPTEAPHHRLGWRRLGLLAYAVWLSQAGDVGAVERTVEFRDGSRLTLDLPNVEFELHTATGTDKPSPQVVRRFALAESRELVFSKIPALKRIERINQALKALRSDEYAERERAVASLPELAAGFRPLITEQLANGPDPDLRWRLRRVLKQLPREAGDDFDYANTGGETDRGEIAPWTATARYRGAEIRLSRNTVHAIRDNAPGAVPEAATFFEALVKHDPGAEPPQVHVVDFENGPEGDRLHPGDNIERRFSEWGVMFSTSIKSSYVAVNKYKINDASPDQAAATLDPIYEGVVTARFCSPHDPARAAGVHFVSCRLAVVKAGGTALVALDAFGNELGRAVVEDDRHAYLAVRSGAPIAAVQLVPNLDIDADYTFDDFTFDHPEALDDAPHPRYHALLLRDGSRVHCAGLAMDDMDPPALAARPGVPFADVLRVPISELVAILPAAGERQPFVASDDVLWALLEDGSKLFVQRAAGPGVALTLAAGLPLLELPVAAIWNATTGLQTPAGPLQIPQGGAAMVLRADPTYLSPIEFRPDEFVGAKPDGSEVIYNYSRMPSIWLRSPPEGGFEIATRTPRVVTTAGEVFRIGAGGAFEMTEITDTGIALRSRHDRQAVSVTMPYSRISSLHLPPPRR